MTMPALFAGVHRRELIEASSEGVEANAIGTTIVLTPPRGRKRRHSYQCEHRNHGVEGIPWIWEISA